MKFLHLPLCLSFALLSTMGCGHEDPPQAPPPPAPKHSEVTVGTPPATPPPVSMPPPAAGNAITPPAPEAEPTVIKDPDGKTLSALQYLQSLADAYARTRASQTEGTPWPPLVDLQQLVNVGLVKRLPSPPAGQKFSFDQTTGKVTVVPN